MANLSQHVGNFSGELEEYKKRQQAIGDVFLPDLTVQGRTVAVLADRVACTTVVKSGTALVFTTVDIAIDTPAQRERCQFALDYTRATISEMPR